MDLSNNSIAKVLLFNYIPSINNENKGLLSKRLLFFFIGTMASCQGSTGILSSKTFGVELFLPVYLQVYFTVNIFAYIIVMLFVKLSFFIAVVSSWATVFIHLLFSLDAAFCSGNAGKYIYITLYGLIGFMEIFLLQANSYVLGRYYDPTMFSTFYAGYIGGIMIFSSLQVIYQSIIGSETSFDARLALSLTHSTYTLFVLIPTIFQTMDYLSKRDIIDDDYISFNSCVVKFKGMYKMILNFPKVLPRFFLFMSSEMCKCAFSLIFIPYLMNLTDLEVTSIYLIDCVCDIIGRFIANGFDESVPQKGIMSTKGHIFYIIRRNIKLYFIPLTYWICCSFIVWTSWTLKYRFITWFAPLTIYIIVYSGSMGCCSNRGLTGCVRILEYYNNAKDIDGYPLFPDEYTDTYNYINELNTFIIKVLWYITLIVSEYFADKLIVHQKSIPYKFALKIGLIDYNTAEVFINASNNLVI